MKFSGSAIASWTARTSEADHIILDIHSLFIVPQDIRKFMEYHARDYFATKLTAANEYGRRCLLFMLHKSLTFLW